MGWFLKLCMVCIVSNAYVLNSHAQDSLIDNALKESGKIIRDCNTDKLQNVERYIRIGLLTPNDKDTAFLSRNSLFFGAFYHDCWEAVRMLAEHDVDSQKKHSSNRDNLGLDYLYGVTLRSKHLDPVPDDINDIMFELAMQSGMLLGSIDGRVRSDKPNFLHLLANACGTDGTPNDDQIRKLSSLLIRIYEHDSNAHLFVGSALNSKAYYIKRGPSWAIRGEAGNYRPLELVDVFGCKAGHERLVEIVNR